MSLKIYPTIVSLGEYLFGPIIVALSWEHYTQLKPVSRLDCTWSCSVRLRAFDYIELNIFVAFFYPTTHFPGVSLSPLSKYSKRKFDTLRLHRDIIAHRNCAAARNIYKIILFTFLENLWLSRLSVFRFINLTFYLFCFIFFYTFALYMRIRIIAGRMVDTLLSSMSFQMNQIRTDGREFDPFIENKSMSIVLFATCSRCNYICQRCTKTHAFH